MKAYYPGICCQWSLAFSALYFIFYDDLPNKEWTAKCSFCKNLLEVEGAGRQMTIDDKFKIYKLLKKSWLNWFNG